MEETFRIAEVNGMGVAQLVSLFRGCVAVDRWARELADGRPFADLDGLLARADELSASLTDAELRHALDDHPRIGARTAAGSMSAAEQSGVDSNNSPPGPPGHTSPPGPPGVTLADRLLAANRAYEERFGHIYLVCASGRDGEELLADCAARMANDPVTELGVVRRELGRIANLRLTRMIGA